METTGTNGNTTNQNEAKQENGTQEQNRVSDHDQHAYSTGQSGHVGPSWNEGHNNGAQGNNYSDVAGEPEQHGIGIKEDG